MTEPDSTAPRVVVLSVAHDLADARLDRLSSALTSAGAAVELHGIGSADRGPLGVECVGRDRAGPIRRLSRALILPFRVRGDVLVVVDPDLFLPAVVAGRVRRLPIVCDVHEDYRRVASDRAWARGRVRGFIVRAAAILGARVSARATLTMVADDHVPPPAARKRIVVRNLPRPVTDAPTITVGTRAAYVGDVRISRGALTMIDGIIASPPWELDIVGPVNPAERPLIEAAAARSDRVRLHGRLPPAESWVRVAGASVGLSLLDSTPGFVDAMPTKVYEYGAAGMAIVTSPLPRVAAVVDEFGVGAVVASPEDFAAILSAWQMDPNELKECCRRGASWAGSVQGSEWPFDRAAQTIVGLFDKRATS